jgi:hypothetical protein
MLKKINIFKNFATMACAFYLVARTGLAGLTAISVSESVLAEPEGTWVLENKTMGCKLVNIRSKQHYFRCGSRKTKITNKKVSFAPSLEA